jgi:hypothetical protein
VRFSPDGRWVASSGKDGTIMIWDMVAAKHIETLKVSPTYVSTFEFNPSDFLLAAVTSGRMVKVFDIDPSSMNMVQSTPSDLSAIKSMAFGPYSTFNRNNKNDNEQMLVTGTKEAMKLYTWDASDSNNSDPITLTGVQDMGPESVALSDIHLRDDGTIIGASYISNFVSLYETSVEQMSSYHLNKAASKGDEHNHRRQQEKAHDRLQQRPPFSLYGSNNANNIGNEPQQYKESSSGHRSSNEKPLYRAEGKQSTPPRSSNHSSSYSSSPGYKSISPSTGTPGSGGRGLPPQHPSSGNKDRDSLKVLDRRDKEALREREREKLRDQIAQGRSDRANLSPSPVNYSPDDTHDLANQGRNPLGRDRKVYENNKDGITIAVAGNPTEEMNRRDQEALLEKERREEERRRYMNVREYQESKGVGVDGLGGPEDMTEHKSDLLFSPQSERDVREREQRRLQLIGGGIKSSPTDRSSSPLIENREGHVYTHGGDTNGTYGDIKRDLSHLAHRLPHSRYDRIKEMEKDTKVPPTSPGRITAGKDSLHGPLSQSPDNLRGNKANTQHTSQNNHALSDREKLSGNSLAPRSPSQPTNKNSSPTAHISTDNGRDDVVNINVALDQLSRDCKGLASLLSQRKVGLRMLRKTWEKGDIDDTIDNLIAILEAARHDSLQYILLADFFHNVRFTGPRLTLDICVRILPCLQAMFDASNYGHNNMKTMSKSMTLGNTLGQNNEYLIITSLSTIITLHRAFGDLIRRTCSTGNPLKNPSSVDLKGEERYKRCLVCQEIFRNVRRRVEQLAVSGKQSNKTIEMTNMFLQVVVV